jgi:DsbC/DsbD-like thiol-disulfide interchange protein
MLRALLISTALLPALAAGLARAPAAQAGGVEEMVHLEVLEGWRAQDGTHMAALRLRLAPGWKTFWRAPGDAGIPPRFALEPSENLAGLVPVWPTPEVFDVGGLRTIGYSRELLLPLRVMPERAGAPVRLEGRIEMGICSDVCVPATLALSATLPAGGSPDIAIQTALIDVPYTPAEAGVTGISCSVAAVQYGLGFRSEIALPAMGGDETVVIETGDPLIWVAETQSWWEGGTLVTETEMSHADGPGVSLSPQDVRITVIGDGIAVEIDGCPAP